MALQCMDGSNVRRGTSIGMPNRPKRPCRYLGCPSLGVCPNPAHSPSRERKDYDQRRGTATARGYDKAWSRFSAAYRTEHPLCVAAQRNGRVNASDHVDHIIPLSIWRGHKYDGANLQALSQSAHSAKTMQESQGNRRNAPLACWPYVPWHGDLTVKEAHEFIAASADDDAPVSAMESRG